MTEPYTEPVTFHREVAVRVSTDGDGRTLVSRLVPYNQTTTVSDPGGVPYLERFVPGAFKAQLRAASRVMVNYRHGQTLQDQIGHAASLNEAEDGLYGHLRVLDTPDADKALQLVNAGVLDRLSIEFASLRHRVTDGVVERLNARLLGIALTPNGAYPGAEVIAVREEVEPVFVEQPMPLDPALAEKLRAFVTVPADLLADRAFTDGVWDPSPSRWPDAAAYCRSCLIDDNTEGAQKSPALAFLPVIEIGGAVNIHAVRAALDELEHVRTSDANKARARRRIDALMAEFEQQQTAAA